MSMEKAALMMFKGILADLPVEERAKVDAAKEQISRVVNEHGDAGTLALQWLMLEMAVEA